MMDDQAKLRERDALFQTMLRAFSHTAHGVQHEGPEIEKMLNALDAFIDAKIEARTSPPQFGPRRKK